jgi:hypothetical protein
MTVALHSAPRFLDAATLIGLVGCIAKLSELILDSHQQAQFQLFMDRLTERLIDLNVVKWYPRLRKAAFNVPIFLFIVGVEWVIIARLGRNPKLTENLKTLHVGGWQPYARLACFQFLIYLGIVNWLARIRRAWVFCMSTLIPGILAIPFIIISAFSMVGWTVYIGMTYKDSPQVFVDTMFMVVLWCVLGSVAIAGLWLYLSAVLFALGLIVSLLWLTAGFLRELFWRMTTYAKGAWAAVWIVVTAILTITDVFLRTK